MNLHLNLNEQHVVVIGGTSGIGLAVAQGALAAGARVSVVGRSAERLAAAASLLPGAQTRVADIEDPDAVNAAFQSLPAPDHVYIAAGRFVGGSILDGELADFRGALEARVWGAVHAVRAAAPRMTGPRGSFVFTGGVSSDRPVKGAWATAIATAAAEQLARALTLELAPLRFNAIAPGWTDTPMWDAILGEQKQPTFASVGGQLPAGRITRADEAAQAVLMLMANQAIGGETIHVDGGHRLV